VEKLISPGGGGGLDGVRRRCPERTSDGILWRRAERLPAERHRRLISRTIGPRVDENQEEIIRHKAFPGGMTARVSQSKLIQYNLVIDSIRLVPAFLQNKSACLLPIAPRDDPRRLPLTSWKGRSPGHLMQAALDLAAVVARATCTDACRAGLWVPDRSGIQCYMSIFWMSLARGRCGRRSTIPVFSPELTSIAFSNYACN
jgi:hypothetical protein